MTNSSHICMNAHICSFRYLIWRCVHFINNAFIGNTPNEDNFFIWSFSFIFKLSQMYIAHIICPFPSHVKPVLLSNKYIYNLRCLWNFNQDRITTLYKTVNVLYVLTRQCVISDTHTLSLKHRTILFHHLLGLVNKHKSFIIEQRFKKHVIFSKYKLRWVIFQWYFTICCAYSNWKGLTVAWKTLQKLNQLSLHHTKIIIYIN